MIEKAVFAAIFSVVLSSLGFSADPSPQPTKSPSTSSKHTMKKPSASSHGLKQLNKVELSRFIGARTAIRENIAKFDSLVKSGGKSKRHRGELARIAGEITKQAATIQRYSELTNNSAAEKIASQLILDDDVAGRQISNGALAQHLLELDAQLALLEPVVHR